jgi:hypothetical protein
MRPRCEQHCRSKSHFGLSETWGDLGGQAEGPEVPRLLGTYLKHTGAAAVPCLCHRSLRKAWDQSGDSGAVFCAARLYETDE